jgi:anti-sigma regulatory factor (Ser/Thr protein kinase)
MISLPIHGSTEAPRIARNAVLSRLDGRVTDETARDTALVISELVTNSVVHANLGEENTVLVEVTVLDDRLAITVTDPGSDLTPRLLPWDLTKANGLGLHLVDHMCLSWGVHRNPSATEVWCELGLGEPVSGASELAREAPASPGGHKAAPARALATGHPDHPGCSDG